MPAAPAKGRTPARLSTGFSAAAIAFIVLLSVGLPPHSSGAGGMTEVAPASPESSRQVDDPADRGDRASQPTATAAEDAGIAVYVGTEMIRPYDPVPMLAVPESAIERARHPAIDIHCHWWLSRRFPAPEAMLAAMDRFNVAIAVNLSGGWGESLDAMLAWCSAAPDRLLVFANLDLARIDEPEFAVDSVAALRHAKRRGARGLKVFKDLGLTLRDRSGALVAVDDPRLDPIWAACGELGLPVLIHAGDPAAFFEPVDARNERWMQLRRHPDWSFHGPGFPDRATLFAQRSRLFERHRGTTFIAAHLADHAEDLAAASRLLEAHPNVVMDIAGRVAELGRQPYSARSFLIRWQDRVLYGTDRYPGRPDQPRERIYYRFLETSDEYFRYHDHPFPPEGEWRIYGVELPDDVLRKIYLENAARVLGLDPHAVAGLVTRSASGAPPPSAAPDSAEEAASAGSEESKGPAR
ncbi:MAG TPA: amidohydrolase family protein [Phycisphaerales bacterium]|nr:amidohydrolase family protein [Phycisphaerales bacterium]HMP37840.1 amidohydrolase family protein [Phycisphaerales bacterium]